MKEHERINKLLVDFTLGELSQQEETEVKKHLSECPQCNSELKQLGSLLEFTGRIRELSADKQICESARQVVLDTVGSEGTKPAPGPNIGLAFIWRTITKSTITKLAAAAVIIAATMTGIRWFSVAAPAYGITEALKLCENAKIVHIKGWYFPHTGDDTQLERFPFEFWFDKKNGRIRDSHPIGLSGDYTSEPKYSLTVSDGQYLMKATGRGNRGAVEFTKLSPFQQRLRIHTLEVFPGFMGNLHEVKGFVKVGQEQIKNKTADIWEGEVASPGETIPYKKYRIWLSPSTGEILRIFRWANVEEDSVRWQLRMDANTIEYNVTPPADCFKTDPPQGYELRNSKETAIERELGDPGRVRFYGCIGFTLNDGSVIFGWHANHKPEESQAHLFANLKLGGPLPNLPAQIVGLKPWPVEEDITFVGRHLAYTQKNGKFYEWGIYVPNKKMPERDTFQDYKVITKYNGVEPRSFLGRPNLIGQELSINLEQEFNTWVRGAMAELSADRKAPVQVTYENVLRLAEQIRHRIK
jgi:hypothetical protein